MPQPARSLSRPQLPLWAKWVLSFAVGAALLVALIIYVDHHNTDSPPSQNLEAQTRANQEAALVVERDQAPHVIRLSHGATPVSGISGAVRTTMSGLISRGIIDGPLQKVRCTRHGGGPGTPAFSCVATANDVNYDFVGVANVRARQVTYCKRDEPPVPSMNIPVSRRCVA
jgi:hypothetical protein